MDRKQTAELLQTIQASYPGKFNPPDPARMLDTWEKALRSHDSNIVSMNFERHLTTSVFPPTIADLVKVNPSDRLNAIPNAEETRDYLATLQSKEMLTQEQHQNIEAEKAKIRKILGLE